jgi:hypothetical protein
VKANNSLKKNALSSSVLRKVKASPQKRRPSRQTSRVTSETDIPTPRDHHSDVRPYSARSELNHTHELPLRRFHSPHETRENGFPTCIAAYISLNTHYPALAASTYPPDPFPYKPSIPPSSILYPPITSSYPLNNNYGLYRAHLLDHGRRAL